MFLLSPRDVVEKMSFAREPREPLEEPRGPPPSEPPPEPPEPTLPWWSSYQQQATTLYHRRHGDPNLQPNVGLTNSYDYALFGLALSELLECIQMANILASMSSTTLSILVLIFSTTSLPQIVLSSYLIILGSLLTVSEFLEIWPRVSPRLHDCFRENLGILHRPLGTIFYTMVLGSMCVAVGGLLGATVALIYVGSAFVLLAARCSYSELRDVDDAPEEFSLQSPAQRWTAFSFKESKMWEEVSSTESLSLIPAPVPQSAQ